MSYDQKKIIFVFLSYGNRDEIVDKPRILFLFPNSVMKHWHLLIKRDPILAFTCEQQGAGTSEKSDQPHCYTPC